jgi:CRISPR-associated endonuclease/helicase Cas3
MTFFVPIAHVSGDGTHIHHLDEHLSGVAQGAEQFAAEFGAEEWGRIAGSWHDFGKFSDAFQRYIRGASGFEAHLVDVAPGKVNHSSAGALLAERLYGKLGLPLAYLVAGHHAGLPDWFADEHGGQALENRLREGAQLGLLDDASGNAPPNLLDLPKPAFHPERFGGLAGLHLWIRMLFSCLTDADFLDTESFMQPDVSGKRGKYPDVTELSMKLRVRMEEMVRTARPSDVNRIRTDVLRQCREKSELAPGLYTLTVPTGGGKTLSSLAFALEHAARYGKHRVIYAIPYTSIIEQTASVFRDILGTAVLEHHSNLDSQHETPESRLAAENWDAPLIVTTNVQLFESLFSSRTSRCRKLHNLANSVLILDEAQMLPPAFLQPILHVIRLLIAHYGVTVVLCTATQPALGTQFLGHGQILLNGLDEATEIVDETERVYEGLDRVDLHLPADLSKCESWDAIAERINRHDFVLAIVNSRADCGELHRRMSPGTIHLSALMCGEHRSVVIAEIKDKLSRREAVQVISTQLIEAGVDIDFPVVYRAIAGLDSIAQAAGRCNREGNLSGKGQLFVFVPPRPSRPGLLRFGEDACRVLLGQASDKTLIPRQFRRYFELYYSRVGGEGLDKHRIGEDLSRDARECKIQFRTASEKFKLIDDEASASILVPYANPHCPERDSRALFRRLQAGEMHRGLLRELQRYTVSIPRREFEQLQRDGELEGPQPGLWLLRNETAYRNDVGLLIAEGNPDPEKLYY